MKLTLRQQLSQFGQVLQGQLFPVVEEALGPLEETARRVIATLEMIPLERYVPVCRGWIGRPSRDRLAIARAFVAKAVCGMSQTRELLDRLCHDRQLLAICGWNDPAQLPHESTFSRAFAEFAEMELPQLVHEALIRETQKGRLIGHIARDSTAIQARERLAEVNRGQAAQAKPAARKALKARPRQTRWKGGKPQRRLKEDTRLHRQRGMSLEAMLAELPRGCSIGVKINSKGHPHYWRGYKLHLDVADGQIPVSAVLTGAKLHDSQVCIPLARMTSDRVSYCYELMDAAYDAEQIRQDAREQGHVAIIDRKRIGNKNRSAIAWRHKPEPEMSPAEAERFKERTMIERVNGRLKDEFGGRDIRVRGAAKVMAHLMFGVLALTVDQLMRLVR